VTMTAADLLGSGIDPARFPAQVSLQACDTSDLASAVGGEWLSLAPAFLAAGGYHHHIGLNTWESLGGSPPPPGHTGLYHAAIRYPDRKALADALRRLVEAGITLDGASDHGVSEALYLRDPDGNGLELYRDRPREEWPTNEDGTIGMFTQPLDVRALLAEAE